MSDQLEKLIASDYPLLSELEFRVERDAGFSSLPSVIGLILFACARRDNSRSCCLMLPDIRTVATLSALVASLSWLRNEFPRLLDEYAKKTFKKGQRVSVLPAGQVYEFAGHYPSEMGSFFRLKVLNKNEWRAFPVHEIQRLQPTEAKRPKGKLDLSLGEFQESYLDSLIGIHSGGNVGLFGNYVYLLTGIAEFQQILAGTEVRSEGTKGLDYNCSLSDFVPWGTIKDDGHIVSHDLAQCDPLVVVTYSIERLADACASVDSFSRPVIIDGASRISNMQAFDSITEKQRAIILASHNQYDQVSELKRRGCALWRLSPAEILLGEVHERARNTVLGPTVKAARNFSEYELKPVICQGSILDEAAEKLRIASDTMKSEGITEEEYADLWRLIGSMYRRLMELSDLFIDPDASSASTMNRKISHLESELSKHALFLPVGVSGQLSDVAAAMRAYMGSVNEHGKPKRESLISLVKELRMIGLSLIIVTGSQVNVARVGTFLDQNGITIPVYAIRAVPDDVFADVSIITSWPTKTMMQKLVSRYQSRQTFLMAYAFESLWLNQFEEWRQRYLRESHTTLDTKTLISGLSGNVLQPVMEPQAPAALIPQPTDGAIQQFDWVDNLVWSTRKGRPAEYAHEHESRLARYVGFVGPGYGYITESRKLPVVTDLVSPNRQRKSGVQLRTVDKLKLGDFALFRTESDSDLIRLVAEQSMGEETYRTIRKLAGSWHDPLTKISPRVEQILSRLQVYGFRGTIYTVRNWLRDPDIIGPGHHEDLELIGKAAADKLFSAKLPTIWEAIRTIRGAHIAAGSTLSSLLLKELQEKVEHVDAEGTSVDLFFGKAVIVQVEEIADTPEERHYCEVNRILWDED